MEIATPSSATLAGAWTNWNFTPTPEATAAFKEATQGLVGVHYKLLAFASQLVNGTNYAFLCEAQAATQAPLTYPAVIHAYKPINEKATITAIKKVGPYPNPVPGGWANWNFQPTSEAKDVFTAALKGYVGVGYQPLAFTTQVVAGINYCYLAQGTVVVPGAPQKAALVYIHQPLPGQGEPHVTGIKEIPTH
jgi:hypothetical protein